MYVLSNWIDPLRLHLIFTIVRMLFITKCEQCKYCKSNKVSKSWNHSLINDLKVLLNKYSFKWDLTAIVLAAFQFSVICASWWNKHLIGQLYPNNLDTAVSLKLFCTFFLCFCCDTTTAYTPQPFLKAPKTKKIVQKCHSTSDPSFALVDTPEVLGCFSNWV